MIKCMKWGVIVADGTNNAALRLSRVLRSDAGMGIISNADAGYDTAKKQQKNMVWIWESKL